MFRPEDGYGGFEPEEFERGSWRQSGYDGPNKEGIWDKPKKPSGSGEGPLELSMEEFRAREGKQLFDEKFKATPEADSEADIDNAFEDVNSDKN